jgi:hypothetical protein
VLCCVVLCLLVVWLKPSKFGLKLRISDHSWSSPTISSDIDNTSFIELSSLTERSGPWLLLSFESLFFFSLFLLALANAFRVSFSSFYTSRTTNINNRDTRERQTERESAAFILYVMLWIIFNYNCVLRNQINRKLLLFVLDWFGSQQRWTNEENPIFKKEKSQSDKMKKASNKLIWKRKAMKWTGKVSCRYLLLNWKLWHSVSKVKNA